MLWTQVDLIGVSVKGERNGFSSFGFAVVGEAT
jgi:hypothetical protein